MWRSPTISNRIYTMALTETFPKKQPWKQQWPPTSESKTEKLQCDDKNGKERVFGFKKGDYMVFEGNIGNFIPRDRWNVEYDAAKKEI